MDKTYEGFSHGNAPGFKGHEFEIISRQIFVRLDLIRGEMRKINERITGISEQVADLYKKVDKADQWLEQSRITDAKIDRILAAWVTHVPGGGGGGQG